METRTFILLSALLLGFSCSVSEDTDTQDPGMVSLNGKSPVMELLSKEGSKKAISSLFKANSTAKGNGNGIIFFENQGDLVACGGGGDQNFFCVYEIKDGFYNSPIDVTILPNGEAQFQARSREFKLEVYTPDFEELLYSNLCLEDFKGNLHINLKAPYDMETFEGIDIYFPDFTNPSTANNFQMTAEVDDGVRNLDIENLTWDCDPGPRTEKKFKVTSLFMPNGKVNIRVKEL